MCSAWTTLEFRSLLPYFHNGGEATLEQVVDFYNRGGDRRGEDGNDTTGFGPNHSNLDADIDVLDLTAQEKPLWWRS